MIGILEHSKHSDLIGWMESEQVFSTSQVISWGLEHRYIRANRTKQQLAHDGVIEKLSRHECILLGYSSKQGVYRWKGQPDGRNRQGFDP